MRHILSAVGVLGVLVLTAAAVSQASQRVVRHPAVTVALAASGATCPGDPGSACPSACPRHESRHAAVAQAVAPPMSVAAKGQCPVSDPSACPSSCPRSGAAAVAAASAGH